jgi:alpha-glucosidase
MTRFALLLALVVPSPSAESHDLGVAQPPVLSSTTDLHALSPDGLLRVGVQVDDGGYAYWSVTRFGEPVLRPGKLGMTLARGPLDRTFRIVGHRSRTHDETWEQPWGEQRLVRDAFGELTVELETQAGLRLDVIVRAYDDGVALRYVIPEQDALDGEIRILDEATEFAFTGDHTTWSIDSYQWNRYEYLYRERPLVELAGVHTPVTLETDGGLFLSAHEAALTDWASLTLARTDTATLAADLVPWHDGVRVRGSGRMTSPWRTLQVADTAAELIESTLVLNLNEPNVLGDVSYAEPGKYVGVWWEMHIGKSTWGSGPQHGATTENVRRYIDFAAENGFAGVLVEGWNTGWDGDWTANADLFSFTEPYPDFDLRGLAAYARERGTRLIGHHETSTGIGNYEAQMDDAFDLYRELGIRSVKTGYVGHGQNIVWTDDEGREHREWHHGQFMVRHWRKVTQAAAERGITLNVHEPVHDTGIRRTYPNLMTREGARGQEYNAWSKGNGPEHTTVLPFTRMLSGPMDFTPGIVQLTIEGRDNRVPTTVAKQLALYVILYSPLQMAADLPEHYHAAPDALEWIRRVGVDWEQTRGVDARIGDYVTIARQERGTGEWFVGSITDETGRVLPLSLDFLDAGTPYLATIWRDADGTHWQTNPHPITVEERIVRLGDTIQMRLAPGGGQAIHLRPATDEEVRRLG